MTDIPVIMTMYIVTNSFNPRIKLLITNIEYILMLQRNVIHHKLMLVYLTEKSIEETITSLFHLKYNIPLSL